MPTRSYRPLLFILAFVGLVADQASKYGMFNALYVEGRDFGSRDVIPGAFKFFVQYDSNAATCDCTFVKWNGPVPPRVNHGALFSLGGEHGHDANRFFAAISAIAAIGIVVWSFRSSAATDRWLCISLGLILGGTIGNFYDRIVFGGVRDFLYWFYLIDWPVFNVADCCLVVGAFILLVQAAFTKPKAPESSVIATPTPAPEAPATA